MYLFPIFTVKDRIIYFFYSSLIAKTAIGSQYLCPIWEKVVARPILWACWICWQLLGLIRPSAAQFLEGMGGPVMCWNFQPLFWDWILRIRKLYRYEFFQGCVHNNEIYIIYFQMEVIVERMQDEVSGVPVRTVKSFMSKVPSVFTGGFSCHLCFIYNSFFMPYPLMLQ